MYRRKQIRRRQRQTRRLGLRLADREGTSEKSSTDTTNAVVPVRTGSRSDWVLYSSLIILKLVYYQRRGFTQFVLGLNM